MKPFIIGIAGGSGSGKTTLAYSLKNKYPDLIEVMHFDDYQKEKENLPIHNNMENWDHPNAIDFNSLEKDLEKLLTENKVELMTKSKIVNPTYEEKGRIKHVLEPKKIIILEGYMTFVNEKIRKLTDYKIYLYIPINESMKRRNKITYHAENKYNQEILVPMHKQHVEPTKEYADLVINVEQNNEQQVEQIITEKLRSLNLL